MDKKYKISVIIIVIALLITAVFLFVQKEKKVQFGKSQENIQTENNNSPENIDIQKNNTPEENKNPVDSSQIEDKNQAEDKNQTEDKNSKNDKKPENTAKIVDRLVSWGFQKATDRKIDTIIIHSTYNITNSDPFDLDAIINKEYKPYGVSPHYIINRDGKIYRLVEDKNIAYHAGESKMPDGRTGVNNFSIGIELVNSKTAKPTDEQYSSLKYLISYLKGKYAIKYTLGHSDIAPGRKDDPWNFDFSKIK